MRRGGAVGILRVTCTHAVGAARFIVDTARFGVGGLSTLFVATVYALVLVALIVAVRHAIP